MISLTIFTALLHIAFCAPPQLRVPVEIDFNDSNVIHDMTYEARRVVIMNHTDNSLLLNFTTRLLCYKGNCSIPSPTLIMHPGVVARLRFTNLLVGMGHDTTSPNEMRDIDVTNLHVHGLHVSPYEDDIINITINPLCPQGPGGFPRDPKVNPCMMGKPDYHIYNWTIPSNHYPGTHWYHPHRHGSVTIQVSGGGYGIIKMMPLPQNMKYEPKMKESVIEIAYGWYQDKELCMQGTVACSPFNQPNEFYTVGTRGGFELPSTCWLWCQVISNQRFFSGIQYDIDLGVNPDGSNRQENSFYTVNGQYEPQLSIPTGEWHRLRIVNVDLNYLFFNLDGNCEAYFMAADGVYFNAVRDVNAAPYNGVIIVPIGGRADVAVRCLAAGIYKVMALTYATLSAEQRKVMDNVLGGGYQLPTAASSHLLFTLNVSGPVNTNVKRGDMKGLPQSFEPKTTYLQDTLSEKKVTTATLTPANSNQIPGINLHFPSPIDPNAPDGINGLNYNDKIPLMTFQTNVTHEWIVHIHFHPFHHHTWPFQVQNDFPILNETTFVSNYSGWFVKKGDWRDTLGALGSFAIRARYLDFLDGALVIHCHFVEHEDHGMMTWLNMTTDVIPEASTNLPNQTYPTVDCPLNPVTSRGKSIVVAKVLQTQFGMQVNVLGTCGYEFIFTGKPRTGVDTYWVGWAFGGPYKNNQNSLKMAGHGVIIQFAYNHKAVPEFRVYEINMPSNSTTHQFNKLTNGFNCKVVKYNSSTGYNIQCLRKIDARYNGLNTSQYVIWAYGEGINALASSSGTGFPHLNRNWCRLTMAAGNELQVRTCYFSNYVFDQIVPSVENVEIFNGPTSKPKPQIVSYENGLWVALAVIVVLLGALVLRYMGYLKCLCCAGDKQPAETNNGYQPMELSSG